jgi:5-formyltetrahydrofolate cyclo-ligase
MSGAGPAVGRASSAGPSPEKGALRRSFRARRAAALAAAEPRIAAAARRELPALLAAGQRLGLYWPLAGEPDLRSLAGEHPRLALPAIGGDPVRLVYRPWRPGDPLAPDDCGIPAPAPATAALEPGALGLLLVPALAFDPASGIRLGYGGGWYDRLRADPAWAAVPAVVVLPAACLAAALPRDGWDVPFCGWLDEHGLHGLQGPLAV